MRIGQVKVLNNSELSLLLYIVNVIDPIEAPKFEIGKKELPWINHSILLKKIASQEPKLTDEGKEVLKGLLVKLNKSPIQEAQEWEELQKLHETENLKQMELNYEYPQTDAINQSNFQF